MVARRSLGRARAAAGGDRSAAATRPSRARRSAADVGELDPGHAAGFRRRRRRAHPRRAGRGVLALLSEAEPVAHFRSSPRKRGSKSTRSFVLALWIPAFAGMSGFIWNAL